MVFDSEENKDRSNLVIPCNEEKKNQRYYVFDGLFLMNELNYYLATVPYVSPNLSTCQMKIGTSQIVKLVVTRVIYYDGDFSSSLRNKLEDKGTYGKRKVEVLEREIGQLKSNFVEKISDFENQFASVHEKMEGKFTVVEEMLKKFIEAKPKKATSETRETIGGQGGGGNPNPIRGGENQEVEILEEEDEMTHLEPISREDMSSGYERRGADFARRGVDYERRGISKEEEDQLYWSSLNERQKEEEMLDLLDVDEANARRRYLLGDSPLFSSQIPAAEAAAGEYPGEQRINSVQGLDPSIECVLESAFFIKMERGQSTNATNQLWVQTLL
ncbi:hypothetical protein M5K25_009212 [Dendrobium thyrsiflorum]|uniref:Uncharacterized protein n=1 Tax=Dendrobium thyrsiflorum TaxID=117978 RepID=A0ABD0V4X5_DENTH